MQYSDIINNGTLVYESLLNDSKLREWPVKETLCAVQFYKTEELSELELVLLRLISSCLLYTSPSPRDTERSRMPSSA